MRDVVHITKSSMLHITTWLRNDMSATKPKQQQKKGNQDIPRISFTTMKLLDTKFCAT